MCGLSGLQPPARPGAQRTQETASRSTLALGPANAGKTSQATPAKDSSVAETTQLTRDLQLAKADAQTAKQSEASAQRKLADVEAALQRVREEARRAAGEAERAKADAKTAQELEETTRRNLLMLSGSGSGRRAGTNLPKR